jgi:hypothetical protein
MADSAPPPPTVTPPEARATSQSGPQRAAPARRPRPGARAASGMPDSDEPPFTVGPRVTAAVHGHPYRRTVEDPLYRPLRIFTRDPSTSRLEGAVTTVNVPYEPLDPGPVGALFEVDSFDPVTGRHYRRVDLDAPGVLIRTGIDPSTSDPRFHQQMVYAVCSRVYESFRVALGRDPGWGFHAEGRTRLRLRPHGTNERNAFYDPGAGAVVFGYYEADERVAGRNLPRGIVFTCLSHDIVAHEVTHALLDGLRAHFAVPSHPDVGAFHEAFADLVALFLHFQYPEVVRSALRRSRGRLRDATVLAEIARQFGETTGAGRALRSAIGSLSEKEAPAQYDPDLELHDLGAILVAAVYDAFATVFERKTAREVRLATGGSGQLPRAGDVPPDLLDALADHAAKLAAQFLGICVRAVDYCPPVDLRFGEYLRALVTADHDLVPDDPWGYREALIDAFKKRGIHPEYVTSLSEDALLWRGPQTVVPPLEGLKFSRLEFDLEPGRAADERELNRQASALGWTLARYPDTFGLSRPNSDEGIGPPRIESIRTLRRIGPDEQIVFDLVAEVTQRRRVPVPGRDGEVDFLGGCTIIVGPDGVLRYTVYKRVTNTDRLDEQLGRMREGATKKLWKLAKGVWHPDPGIFKLLHAHGSRKPRAERRSKE